MIPTALTLELVTSYLQQRPTELARRTTFLRPMHCPATPTTAAGKLASEASAVTRQQDGKVRYFAVPGHGGTNARPGRHDQT